MNRRLSGAFALLALVPVGVKCQRDADVPSLAGLEQHPGVRQEEVGAVADNPDCAAQVYAMRDGRQRQRVPCVYAWGPVLADHTHVYLGGIGHHSAWIPPSRYDPVTRQTEPFRVTGAHGRWALAAMDDEVFYVLSCYQYDLVGAPPCEMETSSIVVRSKDPVDDSFRVVVDYLPMNSVMAVAVDESNVYWLGQSYWKDEAATAMVYALVVMSVAKDGSGRPRYIVPPQEDAATAVSDAMVVLGQSLFWIGGHWPAFYGLSRAAKDGVGFEQVLASDVYDLETHDGRLLVCRNSDVLALDEEGTHQQVLFSAKAGGFQSIAAHGDEIYVAVRRAARGRIPRLSVFAFGPDGLTREVYESPDDTSTELVLGAGEVGSFIIDTAQDMMYVDFDEAGTR